MSTEVRVSYDWTLAEIRCVMRLYPRPFWVWGDWKSCGLILVLGIIVGFSIQQVWLSQDIGYPEIVACGSSPPPRRDGSTPTRAR